MLGINIDIKVIRWVPAENRNTIRIRQMTKKKQNKEQNTQQDTFKAIYRR